MRKTLHDLWVLRETDRYVHSGFLPKLEALYAAIRRVSYAEKAANPPVDSGLVDEGEKEETSRSELRLIEDLQPFEEKIFNAKSEMMELEISNSHLSGEILKKIRNFTTVQEK